MDTFIAWQRWDRLSGTPGEWSKLHRTQEAEGMTLCGQWIPPQHEVADMGGKETGATPCQRCFPRGQP